jgi:hypothetical protein
LGNNQILWRSWPTKTIGFLALGLAVADCGASPQESRVQPAYDPATGRLQQLRYDSDNNGSADTVSYMDGSSLLRIEVDKDEDGRVERWEYYGPDRRLEKVGFSRSNDGKEDAWSFAGPDGSVLRIEISTERDGRVTRVEHFDGGSLVRAEADDDRDGKMDRWESYQDERLSAVAFDTARRGIPDRRIVYTRDGNARVEVDPDGDGIFGAAP